MYNKDKILEIVNEIKEESKTIKPYVVVAQPRRSSEETAAQNFHPSKILSISFDGFSNGYIDIFGQKVDVARNYLMESCIESDAKYMLFVGEDTVLPFDAFHKLHKTAEENPDSIVVGVYYYKLGGPMIIVNDGGHLKIPNCDPGQLIDAWLTGMDCMLIPISVLKKMKEEEPELPFCCVYSTPDDIFIGEDNFFTYRLRKHSIKLLVNTDVQCLHMDLATGKYTAHPSVSLSNYRTEIPVTIPLEMSDLEYLEKRWVDRIPNPEQIEINNNGK